MEDYLACVKELQLKLGECGNTYLKKDGQIINMDLMNSRTPFDVFMLTFCIIWKAHKEYCKDYTFESFYVF
jgi:hypothetical protein